VLNKVDMLAPDEREPRVREFVRRLRWKGPVFQISALTHEGCTALMRAVYSHVAALRAPEAAEHDPRFERVAGTEPR
jgi:GTPase